MVLGLVTGPIVWLLSGTIFRGELLGEVSRLYLTLAQIETTLLGFILLTLGIVFTQLNQPRLTTAGTPPSFNELRRIFVSTIKILGAGVIIALISIVSSSLEIMVVLNLLEIMAVLNVSIAAAALLRVARCVWVLEAVIKASLEQ